MTLIRCFCGMCYLSWSLLGEFELLQFSSWKNCIVVAQPSSTRIDRRKCFPRFGYLGQQPSDHEPRGNSPQGYIIVRVDGMLQLAV